MTSLTKPLGSEPFGFLLVVPGQLISETVFNSEDQPSAFVMARQVQPETTLVVMPGALDASARFGYVHMLQL